MVFYVFLNQTLVKRWYSEPSLVTFILGLPLMQYDREFEGDALCSGRVVVRSGHGHRNRSHVPIIVIWGAQ